MPSARRLTGREKSTPYGTTFMRSPEPSPRTARPCVRWSSVRAMLATMAGWRRSRSVTTTPTRIRLVWLPTAAIISSGSK